MEETPAQADQPAAVEIEGTHEIDPGQVLQKFLAAMKCNLAREEFTDNYILNFFGRTFVPRMSGTDVLNSYRHKGFKEPGSVDPIKVEYLKARLKGDWSRLRKKEERGVRFLAAAPSLHLRAESDDDDDAEEEPVQPVTRPPKTRVNLNHLKFLKANGVLKKKHCRDGHICPGKRIKVKLTLGYCQVPGAIGNGDNFKICLAVYDKVVPPCLPPGRRSPSPQTILPLPYS